LQKKNREMVSSFENSQETATWNSSLLGPCRTGNLVKPIQKLML